MRIVWTKLAAEKLEEYADYIALDNPEVALKWTESIRNSVNKLANFSEKGREVPEIKRFDIREIIEGHYRIIYKIEPKQISVLTIRHDRQLLDEKNLS